MNNYIIKILPDRKELFSSFDLDEYISAVIDAFAVEMAHHYKAPDARIKELEAKAAKSMESAMLHDNEDTSYRIGITPKGY